MPNARELELERAKNIKLILDTLVRLEDDIKELKGVILESKESQTDKKTVKK